MEKLVNKKDHFLLTSATDAYRSYLHAYVSHTLKDVYDINNLDLSKLCKSFGLPSPPFVNLNLKILPSSQRRKKLNESKSKYSKVTNYCNVINYSIRDMVQNLLQIVDSLHFNYFYEKLTKKK